MENKWNDIYEGALNITQAVWWLSEVVFQALFLPHCAFHCISGPGVRALASCCHGHLVWASTWQQTPHHRHVHAAAVHGNKHTWWLLTVLSVSPPYVESLGPSGSVFNSFNDRSIIGLYFPTCTLFCHVFACWKLCPSQKTKFLDQAVPKCPSHTIIWFVLPLKL